VLLPLAGAPLTMMMERSGAPGKLLICCTSR
jgi:hypothetical protein